MSPLTATAVRVGMRVLLIPDGQPVPEGAVVYGKAPADLVYRVFYGDTHCPQGHERVPGSVLCREHARVGSCAPSRTRASSLPPEWTWGEPA